MVHGLSTLKRLNEDAVRIAERLISKPFKLPEIQQRAEEGGKLLEILARVGLKGGST